MVERFRHKVLKLLFEEGDATGVNPQHVEKIENILGLLDVAQDIEDMNVPTFRLHALKGDLTLAASSKRISRRWACLSRKRPRV